MGTLEQNIMLRVKTVYWTARLVAACATRRFLFVLLLGLAWWRVSVLSVVHSAIALGRPDSVYQYGVSAFINTDLLVKSTVVGLALLGGWIAFDAARNFRFSQYLRYFRLPRGRKVAVFL